MNIYADRGNIIVLEKRCRWRGIDFQLSEIGIGDTIDPDAYDLFYIGGGQDRDQLLCANDLLQTKRVALKQAADTDAVILGVCGGYQLLGNYYEVAEQRLPGIGLVDLHTVRSEEKRLIGNITIEVDLDGVKGVLAGFENHGGRTYLDSDQPPLGHVVHGHGNNGQDRGEGVRKGNVIGTYLHGPLLPKNVWFADWLIATALKLEHLEPLADESIEQAAHAEACKASR